MDAVDSSKIRAVEARTSEQKFTWPKSSWLYAPNKGGPKNWGNENADQATYDLQLRAKTDTSTAFFFFGKWTV